MQTQKAVRTFRALADETRIQIVRMLRSGSLCACKLLDELTISQSTLSYHMKILTVSGLVKGEKDGIWMHYSLCGEAVSEVDSFFQELLNESDADRELAAIIGSGSCGTTCSVSGRTASGGTKSNTSGA